MEMKEIQSFPKNDLILKSIGFKVSIRIDLFKEKNLCHPICCNTESLVSMVTKLIS